MGSLHVKRLPSNAQDLGPDAAASTIVGLLGFSARVISTCPEIVQQLEIIYPFSAPGGDGLKPPTEQLMISEFDETATSTAESHAEILGTLEYLIDTSAIASLTSYILVHAGAIMFGADGIVLPGSAGAGKSTLVAALCMSGFRYLSDELAVIDRDSLLLQLFPKSVCLKPGGWHALNAYYEVARDPIIAQRLDGTVVRFIPPPGLGKGDHCARIRYIIIPNRRVDASATLTPISRTRALMEILHQSLNLPSHGDLGMEALVRVVQDAICYDLTYSDLHDAVAVLSALMRNEMNFLHHEMEP